MSSDQAQDRLMQVRDELEELLSDNGTELSAERLSGGGTTLRLRHVGTGEELLLPKFIP